MRAVQRAVLVLTDLRSVRVVSVLVRDRRVLSGNGLHRRATTSPEVPAVGRTPLGPCGAATVSAETVVVRVRVGVAAATQHRDRACAELRKRERKLRLVPRRKDEHRTKQKGKHQGSATLTEMVRTNRQRRAQGKGLNWQASFPNGRWPKRPSVRALNSCTAGKSIEQAQTESLLSDPHVRLRGKHLGRLGIIRPWRASHPDTDVENAAP